MRRGIIASAGAVALAVSIGSVGAFAAVGSASAAPGAHKAKVSGHEKVFVEPSSTTSAAHPGKILLTGTVADYGTVVAANSKGKVTAKGEYRLLQLKKGTILVNITSFNEAVTKAFSHATFDKMTCSISLTASGP
ncbi:MAG TPA: hypothetical protein VMD28_04150, partial [Acidimicrobiales bacterium]|nr:hypothetical protein [Acidimicrobiales bacterium]